MHEVTEVEIADGDVAFEDFFESGFEIGFEFTVESSRDDEFGESGSQVAVGAAHGFDDQPETVVGFRKAFDFFENIQRGVRSRRGKRDIPALPECRRRIVEPFCFSYTISLWGQIGDP